MCVPVLNILDLHSTEVAHNGKVVSGSWGQLLNCERKKKKSYLLF